MTKRQRLFRTIAVAFEAEPSARDEQQQRLTTDGICLAYSTLSPVEGWHPVYGDMYCFLGQSYIGSREDRDTDLLRATVAAFLAALSDEEYAEVVAPRAWGS